MSKLTQVGDFCPNESCADYGTCQSKSQQNIMIAEDHRISSLVRTKGHKEDTIIAWIREAGQHAEKIEAVLLADYQVSRGQIDGLWAYVGHKGAKNYPETADQGQF